jgi:nitrogen fixation NifU-like protein
MPEPMSGDLEELYQSIILDHNRRPQNFRAMPQATAHAEGMNPLCGDQFTVFVKLDGDVVTDVSFQGSGCAISKASASLMTQAVKGRTRAEVQRLFDAFHGLVTGHGGGTELGKLRAFSGVSRFPLRVKCATLAWHAMRSAVSGPAAGGPAVNSPGVPGPSGGAEPKP